MVDDADALLRRQHARHGSGIQVTGSHNPKDYNGFKMVLAGDAPSTATRSRRCASAWRRGDYAHRHAARSARDDIRAAYRDRIVGDIKLARPLKIVVDCGNGIAGASRPASSARSAAK